MQFPDQSPDAFDTVRDLFIFLQLMQTSQFAAARGVHYLARGVHYLTRLAV
jgi:hypothetical protein